MHPNPAYRSDDRDLMETLIDEIGFGMVFATTPDGPRVAHTPLVSTGDGAVQFHLSRGNALTRHLDGMTALAVVNGPDAYVSARWYEDPTQVPTWDYVSLELEGRVRRMDADGLTGFLEALSARHEARIVGGEPWTLDKTPPDKLRGLLGAIIGFELEIEAWRPTVKLHQKAPPHERERVIAGLEAQGSHAIAALIRNLAK
jgi:transcriptional regulator